jgi:uncharacterized glyoxalase superfamily protein PhnB
MSTSLAPKGWHIVTPRLVTDDPSGLIAFVSHVFAAVAEHRAGAPFIINIGDSKPMLTFDAPYGDRRFMSEDVWGNAWHIAVHAPSHVAT